LLDRVSADGAKLAARRVIVPTWVVEYGPPGGKYHLFGRGCPQTANGA
jgi:hypothetical protein